VSDLGDCGTRSQRVSTAVFSPFSETRDIFTAIQYRCAGSSLKERAVSRGRKWFSQVSFLAWMRTVFAAGRSGLKSACLRVGSRETVLVHWCGRGSSFAGHLAIVLFPAVAPQPISSWIRLPLISSRSAWISR
jgi:hypothetical protein